LVRPKTLTERHLLGISPSWLSAKILGDFVTLRYAARNQLIMIGPKEFAANSESRYWVSGRTFCRLWWPTGSPGVRSFRARGKTYDLSKWAELHIAYLPSSQCLWHLLSRRTRVWKSIIMPHTLWYLYQPAHDLIVRVLIDFCVQTIHALTGRLFDLYLYLVVLIRRIGRLLTHTGTIKASRFSPFQI